MRVEPEFFQAEAQTTPAWMQDLVSSLSQINPAEFVSLRPPDSGGRPGAVLILFGDGDRGHDLLLTQRAGHMRSHAGQPAFPGGALDPEDDGVISAALREANEETGVAAEGVTVVGVLPDLWLPPSGFVVAPVLAYWSKPSPIRAGDPNEVAAVHRIPIADLLNPDNRVMVRHPIGYMGPGFQVADMLVWGFTAGVIDRIFTAADWTVPWDDSRIVDVA